MSGSRPGDRARHPAGAQPAGGVEAPPRVPISWQGAAAVVLVGGAIAASAAWLAIGHAELFSARSSRSMARFIGEFFPPDLSATFLAKVAWGAAQTLAVSALGTLLAAALGGGLALPASGRHGAIASQAARLLLNLMRSVPEFVWAVLMVLSVGLGPFAGALALAWHTTGVLGRLYAEALQNAPPAAERALVDAGSGSVAAFAYGRLPLAVPQCLAYTLYRWEMNIRIAAVLGFVGAGGLGQMLYFHLSVFQQAQAATVLIAMLGLVVAVDAASAALRRGLTTASG